MAEPFQVCPDCGKRSSLLEMPFIVFGLCDEHRVIWEMRRKHDRKPLPPDQKPNEWKLLGPRAYSRVGPSTEETPAPSYSIVSAKTEPLSYKTVPPGRNARSVQPTPQPWRRIKTLNLLYHIWPVARNDLWRWNVEQLLKRINLFNGKRVVAIATDDETVPAEEVKRAFAGHEIEFIELKNDWKLREASSFVRLLESVQTSDRSVATFYGHAKGVSRARQIHGVEKKWAQCMLHYCLDFPERVTEALSRKAMFGCSFKVDTIWIFPGTYWWFHNASLFRRNDWRTLANPVTNEGLGWSVEAFPNRFFPNDCERFYPPELRYPTDTQFGLYDPRIWGEDSRVASMNERAKWRWTFLSEAEGMTWGKILDGAPAVSAVGRHAKLAGAKILEVGPGYGRFLAAMVKRKVRFASYTGLEISLTRTARLKQTLSGANISFAYGDIESIKDLEPLGKFNLIVATLVFKRLCPTFLLAATNCRSALEPGGTLIFDVPETGVDWQATDDAQIGSFEGGHGFGAFGKSYHREEIRELLDMAGFGEVSFGHIVHDGNKHRLLVIARRT